MAAIELRLVGVVATLGRLNVDELPAAEEPLSVLAEGRETRASPIVVFCVCGFCEVCLFG